MNIITHRTDNYDLIEELKKIKEVLLLNNDDPKFDEKIKLFEELCEFELGRWLLINQGLNFYWCFYLRCFNEIVEIEKLHQLEKKMLLKAPGVIASRERAKLDLELMQNMLKDNMSIASIPCGFMDDLLRLDLNNYENIKLIGIDLDPKAIDAAKQSSIKYNKQNCSSFIFRDAWQLGIENEFDIIRSSGLNMYVKREEDLLSLYLNFFKAIKFGGYLIVTSNTPPIDENGKMFWNLSKEDADEMPMQGLIYGEIIKVRQGIYCTEKQIINQLNTVGFSKVEVSYDERKMFLGFIAKK